MCVVFEEVVNALTMVPGYFIGAQFFTFLPTETISYMVFCTCSIYYHMWNAVRPHQHNAHAFKTDILSQLLACVCNSQAIIHQFFIFIAFTFFSMINVARFPKEMSYAVSGASITLASSSSYDSLAYWFLSFVAFGVSKRFKIPYSHGLFHILGHKAVVAYWLSLMRR